MAKTYSVNFEEHPEGVILRIGFAEPAQNDRIVVDAVSELEALDLPGGRTVLVNGPASLPVAMALSHGVAHLYEEVACYDPKLDAYVVSVTHGGRPVGSLIRV